MGTSTKYETVREALLERISGLAVGTLIAPERQLASEFGISRMTLRRVIGDLASQGLLTSRQGSGTFVAKPKIAQQLTMTSFTEDMRSRGLQPSAVTLSLVTQPAGAQVGRWLEISPEERVLRACRKRLADDEPMALETLHVPAGLVPGLSSSDLDGSSFYELLQVRYGVTLGGGRQTIEPTVLDGEEARTLGAPVHSPAFLFERVTRDDADRPVEYVRSVYRGDRYRLVTELRAPKRRRP